MVETPTRPETASVLAEIFAELRRERSSEPRWLSASRERAFELFQRTGLPGRGDEQWRSTSLSALQRLRPQRLGAVREGELGGARELALLAPVRAATSLVFVDGFYSEELSLRGAEGAYVTTFGAARGGAAALLERVHARQAGSGESVFTSLNEALHEDGCLVHLPAGAVAQKPIEILHLVTRRAAHAALQPRLWIVLEEGARATVVERHLGQPLANGWTNAVTEIALGRGASLERILYEERAAEGLHLGYCRATLESEASFHHVGLLLGEGTARDELRVVLAGEGARARLDGLYMGRGTRSVECKTFVDHALPGGTSEQSYRGILDDRARGAFAGMVLVRQDAQRSSARQSNKNLLLSESAVADTQPELSILADDVACSHGATVGELDENEVFYLRSRGIDEPSARALLVQAFARAITGAISWPELGEEIDARILDSLAGSVAAHPRAGASA